MKISSLPTWMQDVTYLQHSYCMFGKHTQVWVRLIHSSAALWVTCTACHSDPVLLWIVRFKALSLFLSSPLVTSYTATVFISKLHLCSPSPTHHFSLGTVGMPSPPASPEAALHYPLPTSPHSKKHLCSFSSNNPQGHDFNSPQHHGRCLIFHSSIAVNNDN